MNDDISDQTSEKLWELIDGPVAVEIEELNRASLINVAAALVKSLLAEQAQCAGGKPPIPDEAALRLLHRTATQFLLARPGHYRDVEVHVDEGDVIAFRGQPRDDVKRLMRKFFRDLAVRWDTGDALDVASFALWRITWIHPFHDGNGRTAIVFAYACLCLKLGAWLPGEKTVVDLIKADPARCQSALRAADQALAGPADEPDLGGVKGYLDELLLRQMRTVDAKVCRP